MKKFIMGALIVLSIAMSGFSASAQTATRNGNNFTAQSTSSRSSSKEKTQFTYTDTDSITYEVYILENGRCFIEKVSKKSGNTYRKYLAEDVCRSICQELGREYTYVKKPKN